MVERKASHLSLPFVFSLSHTHTPTLPHTLSNMQWSASQPLSLSRSPFLSLATCSLAACRAGIHAAGFTNYQILIELSVIKSN